MSNKFIPYPPSPAPIEHAGTLENGLTQMRPATLYKGYQAKLAARETACQRMLVTAWEIEETEHFLEFLDALHVDNEERLGFAQEDLNIFRKLFSERDRSDVNNDRDYLQAVYEDEMEILRVVSL
ncbi:uncharacterized protein F5891DRAFT_986357 [Suillus fuscotomentosus]|uniref:Uncharacterized protein n=1 Tax=Suillus fuscotomentosus TaxID=1912939 RepID=A0AAD4DS43_9AGAM|nr:uncharacterized protein F5891DRAFT_986357 [Suillus fuscotomentosus]KAG1892913.1 hypothetical protein F5891DRAFT_986357 [Suillus fuscotomentosus]